MDERTGTVTEFDEDAGYGAVTAPDGESWFFHSTEIGGGSRTIAVGTPVRFIVEAGRRGRWEAVGLRRAP